MSRRVWDISERIEPGTATFPGDNPFSQEWVMRMSKGASCNVSTIRMSVHVGTHADAPLHYDSSGDDIASVDVQTYMGRCRVIEVTPTGAPPRVPADALSADALAGVERVLLRTDPGHDHKTFDPDFVSLGEEAAKAVAAAGVKLVGIDTPSIDHATDQDLGGHHALYEGGVAILENLDLSDVPEGDYELIALPLRIVGCDSSPVRAVLRELS